MKKLGFFVVCLAAAAMTLVGCNKEPQPGGGDQPVIVEDGFYVIGEATVATDFKAANAAIELMGAGFNEDEKAFRQGMYEKYIALEGGKDFELILYQAGKETHYGAQLEEGEVETDGAPAKAYKGMMVENSKMQVSESGFYHIILDLDIDEAKPIDGAQIIIVPCEWGLNGAMNGWGSNTLPDEAAKFDKNTMTFTWKNVLVKSDGEFKFRHGNCWKYVLDKQGKVKAENSLGITGTVDGAEECIPATKMFGGGKNFAIKAGYYDITLTWTLTKGAVGDSFKGEAKKIKDYALDPTTQVFSLIGEAVGSWENDVDFAYVGEANGVYTYKAEQVALQPGQFKVRMDHAWSTAYGWNGLTIEGDVANFADAGPNDYNINCLVAKTYPVVELKFEVENNAIKNVKLVFPLDN